jgi:hypothetical protein
VCPVDLQFYNHAFVCPICNAQIRYSSLHRVIVESQRLCPSCHGEVMIRKNIISRATDPKLLRPRRKQNA